MFIAVAGFVFPHTMQALLDETFTDKIITSYREDPDLQNLIDFGQKRVKKSSYLSKTISFN
jgi:tetraspanin-33